jgi:translation initiation factor 1
MVKYNDWKRRLGMVYSTNPDFVFDEDEEDVPVTLPAAEQKLRVRIEKNGRGGKTVTVVKGFVGAEDDLKSLAKNLKTKCGVGGSVKDGDVIIQGDLKEKVVLLLISMGYRDSK